MREFVKSPTATGPLGPVVSHVDGFIRQLCAVILGVGFLALFLPTLANAVLRYTTDKSVIWSVEAVQLVFPWFIMAGATLAAQHSRHISVEFFIRLLPRSLSRWVTIPVQIIVFAGAAAVLYVFLGLGRFEGGIAFAAGDTMYTSLGVPQSYSYSALLFGYTLLSVTAMTNVYRQATGANDPRLEEHEPGSAA